MQFYEIIYFLISFVTTFLCYVIYQDCKKDLKQYGKAFNGSRFYLTSMVKLEFNRLMIQVLLTFPGLVALFLPNNSIGHLNFAQQYIRLFLIIGPFLVAQCLVLFNSYLTQTYRKKLIYYAQQSMTKEQYEIGKGQDIREKVQNAREVE